MNIREHEGFQIQVHKAGLGYIAEVYRKGKLLKTIREKRGLEEFPFTSTALAFGAAREWIEKTYPKRIKYRGCIQASVPTH